MTVFADLDALSDLEAQAIWDVNSAFENGQDGLAMELARGYSRELAKLPAQAGVPAREAVAGGAAGQGHEDGGDADLAQHGQH